MENDLPLPARQRRDSTSSADSLPSVDSITDSESGDDAQASAAPDAMVPWTDALSASPYFPAQGTDDSGAGEIAWLLQSNLATAHTIQLPLSAFPPDRKVVVGDCTICKESLVDCEGPSDALHDAIDLVQCQHCFHRACLGPWIAHHNTCPTCKAEILPRRTNPRFAVGVHHRAVNREAQAAGRMGRMGTHSDVLATIAGTPPLRWALALPTSVDWHVYVPV
ncbi:hypothetical protein C8R43DRAFT_1118491 [Mycena crocata]|nr:hypothetical protein C8R43DRAFT_1118491 [Mycena crocata]